MTESVFRILVYPLASMHYDIASKEKRTDVSPSWTPKTNQGDDMKRTIINGLIAGLSSTLLVACGGTTDSSSSGSKLMATTAACYATWSSSAVYTGGQTASYNGVNYTAAYWTQGQNPSTNN